MCLWVPRVYVPASRGVEDVAAVCPMPVTWRALATVTAALVDAGLGNPR